MNHILKGANELLRNYLNEFIIQLKFKKGDIITITQKEDGEYKLYSFVLLDVYHSIVLQKSNPIINVRSGGWWEGTLDGKTGWFPSNYVEDIPRLVRMEAIVLNVQSIGREIV